MINLKEHDMEKEITILSNKVKHLEEQLQRLERAEKSIAHHDMVLAKKVSDIYILEQKLEQSVNKDDLEEMKKELKKLEEHENLIFENSEQIRIILKELKIGVEKHELREKHASESELTRLKGELADRLSQIEHQNKVLLKFLKAFEERAEEKLHEEEHHH